MKGHSRGSPPHATDPQPVPVRLPSPAAHSHIEVLSILKLAERVLHASPAGSQIGSQRRVRRMSSTPSVKAAFVVPAGCQAAICRR